MSSADPSAAGDAATSVPDPKGTAAQTNGQPRRWSDSASADIRASHRSARRATGMRAEADQIRAQAVDAATREWRRSVGAAFREAADLDAAADALDDGAKSDGRIPGYTRGKDPDLWDLMNELEAELKIDEAVR